MSFRMSKQLLNNSILLVGRKKYHRHNINDDLQVNMGSAAVIRQHNQPWRFVKGSSLLTRLVLTDTYAWNFRMTERWQKNSSLIASALRSAFYRWKFLFSDDILKMQLKVQSWRKAEIRGLQHFTSRRTTKPIARIQWEMSFADVLGSSLHPKTEILCGAWNPTSPGSPAWYLLWR